MHNHTILLINLLHQPTSLKEERLPAFKDLKLPVVSMKYSIHSLQGPKATLYLLSKIHYKKLVVDVWLTFVVSFTPLDGSSAHSR